MSEPSIAKAAPNGIRTALGVGGVLSGLIAFEGVGGS